MRRTRAHDIVTTSAGAERMMDSTPFSRCRPCHYVVIRQYPCQVPRSRFRSDQQIRSSGESQVGPLRVHLACELLLWEATTARSKKKTVSWLCARRASAELSRGEATPYMAVLHARSHTTAKEGDPHFQHGAQLQVLQNVPSNNDSV